MKARWNEFFTTVTAKKKYSYMELIVMTDGMNDEEETAVSEGHGCFLPGLAVLLEQTLIQHALHMLWAKNYLLL